ncbi:S-locus glycoprotein domain-containing protein [Artemisia annua]|uniref:S-locus glycoprotein domain-containing protein n=1 Tax=Artemisia annua TaxID=35608 RepID=A0A2U1QI75_ARTAN|nr:S-locus glycoprotein domain-containing protein [Artemisia annua]
MAEGKYQQEYISRSSVIQARLGPYNGIQFAGQPDNKPNQFYSYKIDMVVNQEEMYFMFSFNSTAYEFRCIITPAGSHEFWHMNMPLNSRIHKKKQVVITVTSSISAGLILLALILALYIWSKWKNRSDAERAASNHNNKPRRSSTCNNYTRYLCKKTITKHLKRRRPITTATQHHPKQPQAQLPKQRLQNIKTY